MNQPRVLVTKVGLDGHDRAVHMLALELRDRGIEVVMLGAGTTPEQIAAVAVDEDVDVIGVSILSGAHLELVPRLVAALRSAGEPIPVVCGGVIPAEDAKRLRATGVEHVAPVGTTLTEAADLIVGASAFRAEGHAP
jgi:methylmalonyl-CoA mutase C-terminal domain/subunit